jgi:hypothetical protein
MKKRLGLAVLTAICLASPAIAQDFAALDACKADFTLEAALNPQASKSSPRYVVVQDEKLRSEARQQGSGICFKRGTDGAMQLASCESDDVTAYAGEACYFCNWNVICSLSGWYQKKLGKVDAFGNCVAWGHSGCC